MPLSPYVRENINEWSLRSLFDGQKKTPAKQRKPRMPKATPSASMPKPTATAPKSTPTPQPRRPIFAEREHQPLHDIHYHPGLKVFAGSVHGTPLGKAMSERALYGHLINKHGMSHDRASEFLKAARHGEMSPNDATLHPHLNLKMAAFHLSAAHDAHVLNDHPKRETHLGYAELHMDAATHKVEGGMKVDADKIKQHWDTIRHNVHKLDRAMRESRLTPELDALTESLAKSGSSPVSRSKQSPVEDHISSALTHATIARQSQGNAREHHLKIADAHVSRAMEHEGFQPYYEGHPLRAKMKALHATLKGL